MAVRKNRSAVLVPDAENKSTNNNFLKQIYENKSNERLRLLRGWAAMLSSLTFTEEQVLGDYIKVYCELETWMEWTVNLSLSLNPGAFPSFFFFFPKKISSRKWFPFCSFAGTPTHCQKYKGVGVWLRWNHNVHKTYNAYVNLSQVSVSSLRTRMKDSYERHRPIRWTWRKHGDGVNSLFWNRAQTRCPRDDPGVAIIWHHLATLICWEQCMLLYKRTVVIKEEFS